MLKLYQRLCTKEKNKNKKIFKILPKIKILPPKQMFQRLTIALAQVKSGKNSENL